MPDVFTQTKRSEVMSRIRGRGNRDTELRLIELLRAAALNGWRRGQPLFGRPDFAFRAHRLAVFVDGCFWHGCKRHYVRPKNNAKFWRDKIAHNIARDRLVSRTLRKQGWRVVRIWEHDLNGEGKAAIRRISLALRAR